MRAEILRDGRERSAFTCCVCMCSFFLCNIGMVYDGCLIMLFAFYCSVKRCSVQNGVRVEYGKRDWQ